MEQLLQAEHRALCITHPNYFTDILFFTPYCVGNIHTRCRPPSRWECRVLGQRTLEPLTTGIVALAVA